MNGNDISSLELYELSVVKLDATVPNPFDWNDMNHMILPIFCTLAVLFAGAAFFLWVSMLFDAIKMEEGENKIAWVLIILFLNVFGAILYVIFRMMLSTRHLKNTRRKIDTQFHA